MAAVCGVCSGAMVHVVAAALGLALLLSAAPWLFTGLKYVGGAYLVYLGLGMWRSAGASLLPRPDEARRTTVMQTFWQGVLVDVLNPKVILFFIAFLPQFVREGHGSATAQLLLLGTLVVCGAFVVEALAVLAADRLTTWLRVRTRVAGVLERSLGVAMMGLGVLLAFAVL